MAKRLDGLARWLRHAPSGRAIGAAIGAFYIRLVNRTTRWRIEGREHYDQALARGTGVIAVGWHGRLFMSVYWVPQGAQRRHTIAMISNNRDGDLITALVAKFGVLAVRGSTYDHAKKRDKGGAQAYGGAERTLIEDQALVAITPDGPRGPRMRAQLGAARLAIETGAPVQPMTFSVNRGKVLRSWDRFLVPWPFGQGVQIYGPTLEPPSDIADAPAFARTIEAALNDITEKADQDCGRTPVAPDPVPTAP